MRGPAKANLQRHEVDLWLLERGWDRSKGSSANKQRGSFAGWWKCSKHPKTQIVAIAA